MRATYHMEVAVFVRAATELKASHTSMIVHNTLFLRIF